jgi:hypothetical protein
MAVSLIIVTSLLISVTALTYIAYRQIETLESQLTNCRLVQGNRSLFASAGMLGKTMRLCMIAGMLSTPNFYLRRNLADANDIRNIPQKTKRVILFFWYYLILSCSLLAISQGLTSYIDSH